MKPLFKINDCITLKEMLLPDDTPFDLLDLLKKVRAICYLKHKLHLLDLHNQLKVILTNLNCIQLYQPIIKDYNVLEHIKSLRYCVNDSITYEFKDGRQYRFVFTSIDKSNKYTIDDYNSVKIADNVELVLPYLSVTANVHNNKLNSISMYTVMFLKVNNDLKNIEIKTTFDGLDLYLKQKDLLENFFSDEILANEYFSNILHPHELNESGLLVNEMFLKYITNVNADLILKRVRAFVLNNLKVHVSEVMDKFYNECNKLGLNFVKETDISTLYGTDLAHDLNFDHDHSSETKLMFSNLVGENKLEPAFTFSNGSILRKLGFGVELKIDDEHINKIKFISAFKIDNIPTNTDYYIKTGSNQATIEIVTEFKPDNKEISVT